MRPAQLVLGLTVLPLLFAATPPRHLGSGSAAATSAPPNLVAIHDSSSPGYNKDCLSCHSTILTDTSLDPRIQAVHQRMIVFTPGFNPRHGVTNAVCVQCHRATDTVDGSAAGLRVQVDRQLCAMCHGPSGPGPVYYK